MNRRKITLVAVIAALALGTAGAAQALGTADTTSAVPVIPKNAGPKNAGPEDTGLAAGSTLQKDTDRLIDLGLAGILAERDVSGHITRARGGVADLTTRKPVPTNAEFRIGSLTKTFVATTVLQLVGEHRLSLDDSVGRWLPGVVSGNGYDGDKITVRQILQHTGGIPEYEDKLPVERSLEGYQQNRFRSYTPEELVRLALTDPPLFAPGTGWTYSSADYVLAGMIIRKVTGHSWQDELKARILRPLGLVHTFTPGASPSIPNPHAEGYIQFTPNGPQTDVTLLNSTIGDAAGEMISTTDDVNRFLRALVRGRLLRPAQLAAMETTVPAPEFDPSFPGVRYGLGIMWIPDSCGGYWSHAGAFPGFATREGVSKDGSRSVVVSVTTAQLGVRPGTPIPTHDGTNDLIDHALCG